MCAKHNIFGRFIAVVLSVVFVITAAFSYNAHALEGLGSKSSCSWPNEPLNRNRTANVFVWLNLVEASLPNSALLDDGDGFVVGAHTVSEALDKLDRVKKGLSVAGRDPAKFQYIVRTFPADLVRSDPNSANDVSFFASASTNDIQKLRDEVVAVMFDHESIWYDKDPARLPAWSWNYGWTLRQVRRLADTIRGHCIPTGIFVTTTTRPEGKWVDDAGSLKANGYASLLNIDITGITYLFVQAQPRCHEDPTGKGYRDFVAKLKRETYDVFPDNAALHNYLAMQVTIGKSTSNVRFDNTVNTDWATRCLYAASDVANKDNFQMGPSDQYVRSFFLWSGDRSATCEVLKQFRGRYAVDCDSPPYRIH